MPHKANVRGFPLSFAYQNTYQFNINLIQLEIMGRELKRVKLSFDWNFNEIWKGYVNPHEYQECKSCDGMGYSEAYNRLKDEWYSFDKSLYKPNPFNKNARYNTLAWNNNITEEDVKALIEAGRLVDLTHTFVRGEGWIKKSPEYIPTAKEVNEWNLKGMGHDSINCSVVIKARLKKQGISHLCDKCNGTGEDWKSEKAKTDYEKWEPYEPEKGEGYQLWETTSEGSPVSPVFSDFMDLCEWCADNATTFGSEKTTKENWAKMLDDGFVCHKQGNLILC